MNPLYLTQKKIIWIITFSHYISHTQPLFQDLSILPLEKLVLYRIALIMYKMSNSLIPKTMSDLYITKLIRISTHMIHDIKTFLEYPKAPLTIQV